MSTPRGHLRDMIADRVHVVDCGCQTPTGHTPDSLTYYRQVADAVMELVPEVWLHHAAGGRVCYVLRTAPEERTGM